VLHELVAETGVTYDGERLGTLKLFRDPLSMESAKRGAGLLQRLGVEHRILSAEDCVVLEPALAGREALFSGGIHFADDESGDAFKFTNAVAEAARREGVEFLCSTNVKAIRRSGNRVTAVETDRGELIADAYVLALGWAAPALARPLGLRLPIYPVKGYSITFSTEGWNGAPRIPLVDDGRKMAFTPLGRRLRVVGTAEFTGPDTRLTPRRLDSMVERLLEFFPELPNRDSGEPWTGLRPMTPDGIPILGRSPLENLYLNLGHGHLGWTMACGTAKAVADMVSGTAPEVDLAGMTYGRR
jgi:D-amino-acid dehydrogenase